MPYPNPPPAQSHKGQALLPLFKPETKRNPDGTLDRLGPIIRRVESDPVFVKAARRHLNENQRVNNLRYVRDRLKNDPAFKMMMTVRARAGQALRGKRKHSRSAQLVGCTSDELRAHIEKQFKPGMTWQNHGEWHVDHIRPCASFNLLLAKEQAACFHFTNLQPLWAAENWSKNDSWNGGRARDARR
jgi:hypothetical protein